MDLSLLRFSARSPFGKIILGDAASKALQHLSFPPALVTPLCPSSSLPLGAHSPTGIRLCHRSLPAPAFGENQPLRSLVAMFPDRHFAGKELSVCRHEWPRSRRYFTQLPAQATQLTKTYFFLLSLCNMGEKKDVVRGLSARFASLCSAPRVSAMCLFTTCPGRSAQLNLT